MRKELITVVMAVTCMQAYAVNKCTDASGKIAFQDAPCTTSKSEQVKATPASGYADATANQPSASAPAKKPSGDEKLYASLKADDGGGHRMRPEKAVSGA
jgi:hypothetical protein